MLVSNRSYSMIHVCICRQNLKLINAVRLASNSELPSHAVYIKILDQIAQIICSFGSLELWGEVTESVVFLSVSCVGDWLSR